ncbi:MAG: TerB family tellurite resistance protein [Spirochaetes bacterium]|nr:TerB family tellurite resistance protein [Spirochaetota bacterium]
MFERLKSVLTQPGASTTGAVVDDTQRIRIATAVILLEVANSDDDFSEEERDVVFSILKDNFTLSDEEASDLLAVSAEEREGSIDMWHFANTVNENYSEKEKDKVMESIWRVIYADGRLDKYEDHIVHKLAAILHIPHSKMIEAKLKYLPGD